MNRTKRFHHLAAQPGGVTALVVAAGLLAGCAAPTTPRASPSERVAASTAEGALTVSGSTDGRNAQTVYLRKGESGWDLQFGGGDLSDSRIEKVWYWPSERKIAFPFPASTRRGQDTFFICSSKDMDRAARGYTPCTSNFIVPDQSASAAAGRALAAVLSAGLTEIDAAAKGGKGAYRLDSSQLLHVVTSLDIERRWRRNEYRQAYSRVRGRVALASFAQMYRQDDPDGLAREAEERIRRLDENAATLAGVDSRLPALATYQGRYLPANPARYCRSFGDDREALRFCQQTVSETVRGLSLAKAQQARRYDLCTALSRQISGSLNTELCNSYRRSGACAGSTAAETRTCHMLKGEES